MKSKVFGKGGGTMLEDIVAHCISTVDPNRLARLTPEEFITEYGLTFSNFVTKIWAPEVQRILLINDTDKKAEAAKELNNKLSLFCAAFA